MMNKRLTALLLSLALILSVGVVSAVADEETLPAEENAAAAAETENTETAAPEEPAIEPEKTKPVVELEEATANMILFKDVAELVRKNSPAYGALAAQIGYVEEAQELVEGQQETLDLLAGGIQDLTEQLEQVDLMDPAGTMTAVAYMKELILLQNKQAMLQAGVSGLAAAANQDTTPMEAGCRQMEMGAESLYIALVNLEIQEDGLVRQIASLERTLEELQVRKEYGQLSKMQVMELENGLQAAVSGLDTLRMNQTNLKMQLEQMIGEKLSGTVAVGTLPRVTEEQLKAIDAEKDLKTVLRKNPDVQAANNADNALWETGKGGMPDALWDALDDANDYTLENAKQQAEIKFLLLHAKLMSCPQAVEAAKAGVALKQLAYDAAELKYQQGTISHNALLTAADDLQTAKEAVETAENDLFAAYNQYQWAVKHGILS